MITTKTAGASKRTSHLIQVLMLAVCSWQIASAAPANQLSRKEEKAGWKLLFDGETLQGWKRFAKNEPPGKGWSVENGTLHLSPGAAGGDIITTNKFKDFELRWDWKLGPKANNGIKYLVTEQRRNAPGPEFQMVDDSTMSPDKHKTAALYDILPPRAGTAPKPVGDWNQSRLIIRGQQVEHWLNGKKVLRYELESPELKAAIAESKFKDTPDFGKKISGHILLTDHHDAVWYRNIKIREFPPR